MKQMVPNNLIRCAHVSLFVTEILTFLCVITILNIPANAQTVTFKIHVFFKNLFESIFTKTFNKISCYPLQFQLSINLGFSDTDKLTVNVQDNVIGVLKKRFDSATKVLDLEEFHKDTGKLLLTAAY